MWLILYKFLAFLKCFTFSKNSIYSYYIIEIIKNMAVYKDKWDIQDWRFLSIWFFISNLWLFINQERINNLVKSNSKGIQNLINYDYITIFLIVLLWVIIPIFLLNISEKTKIKKFFIEKFHKYEILYYIAWWTCGMIMFIYLITSAHEVLNK